MRITFDPGKRSRTLLERELDFLEAAIVFNGITVDRVDHRENYGEHRVITVGYFDSNMVVIVWTARGPDTRHIISMRYADEAEQSLFQKKLRKARRARDRMGR